MRPEQCKRAFPGIVAPSDTAELAAAVCSRRGLDDHDHNEQHGGPGGHLPGSSENVELVGKITVSGAVGNDKPGHIADVASFGNYAYLAARRLNTSPCGVGGFYTVDISDPAHRSQVSFTAFPEGSYPGEGMQVITLNTPSFNGDVLLTNNENCSLPAASAACRSTT